MPTLHDQRALSEALDLAAGQARAGDKENALIEAAASEYATYYTDKGKEKEVPLVKARSQAESALARERRLQADLNALEEDIVRHAELERSLVTLRRSLADLEAAKERAQETWEKVFNALNFSMDTSIHDCVELKCILRIELNQLVRAE